MRKKSKRLFSDVVETLKRPDMTILPGQLAYFFIMSLVPTLTIIFYIASWLSISVEDITAYFDLKIDSSLVALITPYIENTGFSFSMLVLLIVGIYLSSNGMSSIIVTANNIYGIKQSPFLERKIKAIIMVLILILLFLFILLVPFFGNFILSIIEQVTGYSEIYDFLSFLKTPFSWFIIFFFIKTLYTIAPDKQIPSANVNKGALFTSVGWLVSTEVYLYYVGHFANYNVFYSGLSNIAILMIWIYLLSNIFVIGMGINQKEESYVLERTQNLRDLENGKKSQHKTEKRK